MYSRYTIKRYIIIIIVLNNNVLAYNIIICAPCSLLRQNRILTGRVIERLSVYNFYTETAVKFHVYYEVMIINPKRLCLISSAACVYNIIWKSHGSGVFWKIYTLPCIQIRTVKLRTVFEKKGIYYPHPERRN